MPVRFQILPERGLVYVRYEGFVRMDDLESYFAAYQKSPQSHLGQKRLIDLSRTTGFETDYVRLMAIQAARVPLYLAPENQVVMAFYAPTRVARGFGRVLAAPWNGIPGIVASIQYEEAGVLAILGQPEGSIAHLMKSAA